MILTYGLCGVVLGAVAVVSGVLIGLSLWEVAVVYSGAGGAGVLLSAWLTHRGS